MPAPDQPNTLDIALGYAARGWRVLPIIPGEKYPPIPEWQNAATTDADIIRSWFTGLYRNHGVGIATGPESGIWVLDVDDYDALVDLEEDNEALPATLTSLTGSGGQHFIFSYPTDGTEIRNSAGKIAQGLDVRGDGGQIVAHPTIHPNGKPYEWDAGQPAEPVDAPAWLIELVTAEAEEERPKRDAPTPALRDISTGDRPGDAWAEANDWADILGADGWTLRHTDRKGERHWTRPGKDKREGSSATTGWSANDNLNVFTTSLRHWGLQNEQTYSKFGYLSAVHFGGDDGAAATWLAAQGWGAKDDAVAPTVGASPEPTAPAPPVPADDPDWVEPTVPEPIGKPAPFPLHALPAWCQDHAVAVAEQVQVPVDLTAMLIIGALSAICTGRANVAISPNWKEPTNLYLVAALRSGAGKSAAATLITDWLYRWEQARMDAVYDEWDIARRVANVAKKRADEVEKSMLVGAKSSEDLREAIDEANKALAEVPTLPRLTIDDATPEAAATLLGVHDEALAILSTEADLFDMILKGKAGQRANMNVYLKAWSGDPMTRDRKGGSDTGPESTNLKRPLLTVSVMVQPSVLARVTTDEELTSRGFSARFMMSMPEDLIGRRRQDKRFSKTVLPTIHDYERTATTLADRWASWSVPVQVNVSEDASDLLQEFLTDAEPKLAKGADYERLAEWINKLYASIARYAGILHLAEGNGVSDPLTTEVMGRAITLGYYWVEHALAVLDLAEDPREQSQAILRWAVDESYSEFSLTDLQRGCRRPAIGLDKVADYIPAIDQLIEHGWLRPVDKSSDWHLEVGVRKKGNQSPKFALWPGCIGKPQRVKWNSPTAHGSRGSRIDKGGTRTFSPSISKPEDQEPVIRHANHANQEVEPPTPTTDPDPVDNSTPDDTDEPDPADDF